jgi:hypothetical protein
MMQFVFTFVFLPVATLATLCGLLVVACISLSNDMRELQSRKGMTQPPATRQSLPSSSATVLSEPKTRVLYTAPLAWPGQ